MGGKRDSEDIDIVSHPVDDEAWHALDHFDPEFARDPRSVHLGLSTYAFQPYNIDFLSVFFTLARYRVVKIMHSCSKVVLLTTKHTMVYPGLGPSLEVIALHLAV
jgi:hypothetical protein